MPTSQFNLFSGADSKNGSVNGNINPPSQISFTGRVEKIVYSNPSDKFFIFSMRLDDGAAIKIKGSTPEVKVGMILTCVGKLEKHDKFGDTLNASKITEILPDDLTGIRNLLYSGFVPGIGKIETDVLISWFGTRLFEVAEKNPKALYEIPNLSRSLIDDLCEKIQDKRSAPIVLSQLASLGIDAEKAQEIFHEFGATALSILEEDPYILTTLQNFSFKEVDLIASNLGHDTSSTSRIRSALLSSLRKSGSDGSTARPASYIIQEAKKLLVKESSSIDDAKISNVLNSEIDDGSEISGRIVDGEDFVSLTSIYDAELRIAHNLCRILSAKPKHNIKPSILSGPSFATWDKDQISAAKVALKNSCSVITGRPGCGKTTVTKTITSLFLDAGLTVLQCAPTGRAAKRITEATGYPAMTIHRALGARGDDEFDKDESDPLMYDVVIIDESSMVNTLLLDKLLEAIVTGTIVIFVGDKDQLKSIGAGQVLHDMIRSRTLPTTSLLIPHRFAKGGAIDVNSNRVIEGEMPINSNTKDFVLLEATDESDQLDALIAQYNFLIQDGYKPDEIQILTPYRQQTLLGTASLNEIFKDLLNPSHAKPSITINKFGKGVVFSVDDRVMQTENNEKLGIFNGDIGYITSINQDVIKVNFGDGETSLDKRTAAQLEHAFAITIHKSQGCEFACVLMPISRSHARMHSRNLIYTGMTRGKKSVRLVADLAALKKAITLDDRDERITGLHECLRIEFSDTQ